MAKPFRRSAPPLSTISQQAESAARQKRPSGLALQAHAGSHKTRRARAVGAGGWRAPGVVRQAEVAVAPRRLHPLIEGWLRSTSGCQSHPKKLG